MPVDVKMPALSPTMEVGTLSKWLVKEGDAVRSGDILAEIETDKATMEFEAVDEGHVLELLVPDGAEAVKVGTPIALIALDGEELRPMVTRPASSAHGTAEAGVAGSSSSQVEPDIGLACGPAARRRGSSATDGPRIKASPLARRIASARGLDLATLTGTGPDGRIRKADIETMFASQSASVVTEASSKAAVSSESAVQDLPIMLGAVEAQPAGDVVKLTTMRKVIARRLTESKRDIPHIYLTVDVQLDALPALRQQLNEQLAARKIKLSVNDFLIKAQALALMEVSSCNVMFGGDTLTQYRQADVSVAVSIPGGLITPIIRQAEVKSVSAIAGEMRDLAERARAGKLQPHEFQGGTASLSNMGMYGIKQFAAIINPPQAMILAVGAGQRRPSVRVDAIEIATIMSATGSFDHRAIDGADGAQFMGAFKNYVENPLGLLA